MDSYSVVTENTHTDHVWVFLNMKSGVFSGKLTLTNPVILAFENKQMKISDTYH